MNIKDKLKESIMPILSGLVTFFIFGTAELYLSNQQEFWFSYGTIFSVLVLCAIVIFVCCIAVAIFIPKKIFLYVMALIYVAVIMLYVQGNYLVSDYGQLDGAEIAWEMYRTKQLINLGLWSIAVCGILLATRKFKEKVLHVCKVICCIIVATQVVTLVTVLLIKQPENNRVVSETLTTEGQFEVSSNENTIVFILDAFDAQYFGELLDENEEELVDSFCDFTFYRDTVGGATRTKWAIPYILTGQEKIKSNSYNDYIGESAEFSVLYNELAKLEYDARFYTNPAYLDMSRSEIIDNIYYEEPEPTSRFGLAMDYIKLVAFRYAPDILKQFFWMYSGDFDNWKGAVGDATAYSINDVNFYGELCKSGLACTTDKKVFRFYHLNGPHGPYTMNENIERVSMEETSLKQQALGSLRIVEEFIRQLKEKEVYDNTTIIVMADHGQGEIEQNPLLLIKECNEKKEFEMSEIAITYKDIPNIIVDALTVREIDIDNKYDCDSERLFYYGDGEDILIEYVVKGKAWETALVEKTGITYLGYEKTDDYTYALGTEIYFGSKGTRKHCVSGFSKSESDFTWTNGNSAIMDFLIEDEIDNLKLTLEYGVCNTTQEVLIYANDFLVADYIARGEIKNIIIPGEYLIDGNLRIRFEFPDAVSLKELGQGTDPRTLALSMKRLIITSTEEKYEKEKQICSWEYELGTEIIFSTQNPKANVHFRKGFTGSEASFAWTSAPVAELRFEVVGEYENLFVTMECSRVLDDLQEVKIYANGTEVFHDIIQNSGNISFVVDGECVLNDKLDLTMELPYAKSPQEAGTGNDTRMLGLAIAKMKITSVSETEYQEKMEKQYSYELGEILYFNSDIGNGNAHCIAGFSDAESKWTWTDENKAMMRFEITEEFEKLRTTLKLAKLSNSHQNLRIWCNGRQIEECLLTNIETVDFFISKEDCCECGDIFLFFQLPDAISPKELGISSDSRKLSLAFDTMKIMLEERNK